MFCPSGRLSWQNGECTWRKVFQKILFLENFNQTKRGMIYP
jgi:hypothetical protein